MRDDSTHQLCVSRLYLHMSHSRDMSCSTSWSPCCVNDAQTPRKTDSWNVAPSNVGGSTRGRWAQTPEPGPMPPPYAYSVPPISMPEWYLVRARSLGEQKCGVLLRPQCA